MSTIKDVAREAGVSIATVSRVFNNRGYLSADVKRRVTRAMEVLDYSPNDLARSLHSRKSWLLGIIVPSTAHPFFGELASRIEGYAADIGYKVLFCNSFQKPERERDCIRMFRRSQVDGIILGSHVLDLKDYAGLSLPVISLDRELSPRIPCVSCDNWQGGELAARRLVASGCHNLLHISGNRAIPVLSNARTEAFVAVCRETGVNYRCYELPELSAADFPEEQDLSGVLETYPEADGAFCASDLAAAALAGAALRLGRRIPQDLKIVGHDGIRAGAFFYPGITTIRQPLEEICRRAVDTLVLLMDGREVPHKTAFPVTLVERESC